MPVITKAQRKAIFALWTRNPNGLDYRTFRRTLVRPMLFGGGAVEVDPWCGMYVGIEPDGYTHS